MGAEKETQDKPTISLIRVKTKRRTLYKIILHCALYVSLAASVRSVYPQKPKTYSPRLIAADLHTYALHSDARISGH